MLLTFFLTRAFYVLMWKNIVRDGQSTVDDTAHAYCMASN
jgi:hypothetical protein